MRHPEDLPDGLGWFIALVAGALAWILCAFLLSPPWSHGIGIGAAVPILIFVRRWWREINAPNS